MRRIGTNRIVLADGSTKRNSVVELSAEGYVTRIYPLTEETAMTEWKTGQITIDKDNKVNY